MRTLLCKTFRPMYGPLNPLAHIVSWSLGCIQKAET